MKLTDLFDMDDNQCIHFWRYHKSPTCRCYDAECCVCGEAKPFLRCILHKEEGVETFAE